MSRPVSFLSFFLALALGALASGDDASRAVTSADTDANGGEASTDRVYLRSITALSFSENGRARSSSGPGHQQLRCVGGSASGFWLFSDFYPHQVQCRNVGWDGASIQWGCEAQLDEYVEFGPDTSVKCEPYNQDDPSDGYVLRGSCRLEYTLNFSKFHISFVHIVYGKYFARSCGWG